MAYHPDFPVEFSSTWNGGGWATNIVYGRSGKSFSGLERVGQLRLWNVNLYWLGYTDAITWTSFFDNRQGAYDPFYYFAWYRTSRTNLTVGIGNGATTTFNLPFKDSTSPPSIYKNAVLQTGGGADYTFTANAGTGTEDRVVFTTAPGVGVAITADCNLARERPFVRFKRDDYDTSFRLGDGEIQAAFKFQLEEVL